MREELSNSSCSASVRFLESTCGESRFVPLTREKTVGRETRRGVASGTARTSLSPVLAAAVFACSLSILVGHGLLHAAPLPSADAGDRGRCQGGRESDCVIPQLRAAAHCGGAAWCGAVSLHALRGGSDAENMGHARGDGDANTTVLEDAVDPEDDEDEDQLPQGVEDQAYPGAASLARVRASESVKVSVC